MIKQETLENGLVKTYSDSGKYIIQSESDKVIECDDLKEEEIAEE